MAKVERYPHVNRASKYARDILAGRIPACKYVRLTCERYLVDLEQQSKKVFKYRFDKDKAERACRFQEKLPHTKGEWAFRGEKLKLEPWQSFIIANAFGWVRKKGGKRRFREVYTEVPRKNGKSAVLALPCTPLPPTTNLAPKFTPVQPLRNKPGKCSGQQS
jgi:phage terminase large subunit-like protein